MNGRGLLIIVSAPSGAGKGAILRQAFERDERLRNSVSATTRKPRDGEITGHHYRFVDDPTFQDWIQNDRFLEWAKVHGHCYGTLREELHELLATGYDVVLELDIQGMHSVKAIREDVLTVFIEPPSIEDLEARIRARGSVGEDEIRTRLQTALVEMEARGEYDHVLVNDELAVAVADFLEIVKNERRRLEIG